MSLPPHPLSHFIYRGRTGHSKSILSVSLSLPSLENICNQAAAITPTRPNSAQWSRSYGGRLPLHRSARTATNGSHRSPPALSDLKRQLSGPRCPNRRPRSRRPFLPAKRHYILKPRHLLLSKKFRRILSSIRPVISGPYRTAQLTLTAPTTETTLSMP